MKTESSRRKMVGRENEGRDWKLEKWRMGGRMATGKGHGTWFLNHAKERERDRKRSIG